MSQTLSPAAAAIEYAASLQDSGDCAAFIRLWQRGQFDTLRECWENVPEAVFSRAGLGSTQTPAAYAVFTEDGKLRVWSADPAKVSDLKEDFGDRLKPLYAATQPSPSVSELASLIEGMEVSVDVSTCDDDIGNRYFGTITETQPNPHSRHGVILLVSDAEPNFERKDPSALVEGLEEIIRLPSVLQDEAAFIARSALAIYRNQGGQS